MVNKRIIIALALALTACTGSSVRTASFVKELSMTFSYSPELLDAPEKIAEGVLYLYAKDSEHAGAAEIGLRYKPVGFIPDYGGWYSDHVGTIVSESSLETICLHPIWNEAVLVDCEVKQKPIPHVEFFVAGSWPDPFKPYGMIHKGAIFFTENSDLPGIFLSAYPEDLSEDFLYTETKEEMVSHLTQLSSGNVQSKFINELNSIINSIEFVESSTE